MHVWISPREVSSGAPQMSLFAQSPAFREPTGRTGQGALPIWLVDLAQGDADQALGVQGALHAPLKTAAAKQPRPLLLLRLLLFRSLICDHLTASALWTLSLPLATLSSLNSWDTTLSATPPDSLNAPFHSLLAHFLLLRGTLVSSL